MNGAGRSAPRRAVFVAAALTFTSVLAACAEREPVASENEHALDAVPTDRPYVLVLGTAQDGGLPQIGCDAECCAAARRDPSLARRVTSLLVVDPRGAGGDGTSGGSRWLLDASPDLAAQVEAARDHPPGFTAPPADGGRGPLFDGIFPTHAHTGHYLGLASLGREAYGARGQRLFASERLASFLERNGPWSLSTDTGAFDLARLEPGRPLELADDLSIESLLVPHRDEFSDTFAFVVRGPNAALLYLPDIDKWEAWDAWDLDDGAHARRIEDVIAGVDHALVDGTFFDASEIPGRAMSEIPHPFVVESLTRFASLPDAERAKVHFTHLNHSNPVADPASAAARAVREAGMSVARDGQVFGL